MAGWGGQSECYSTAELAMQCTCRPQPAVKNHFLCVWHPQGIFCFWQGIFCFWLVDLPSWSQGISCFLCFLQGNFCFWQGISLLLARDFPVFRKGFCEILARDFPAIGKGFSCFSQGIFLLLAREFRTFLQGIFGLFRKGFWNFGKGFYSFLKLFGPIKNAWMQHSKDIYDRGGLMQCAKGN